MKTFKTIIAGRDRVASLGHVRQDSAPALGRTSGARGLTFRQLAECLRRKRRGGFVRGRLPASAGAYSPKSSQFRGGLTISLDKSLK